MCPDASDPLMAENGMPAVCGAGFDGVKMCPKGYYCAIDGAKGCKLSLKQFLINFQLDSVVPSLDLLLTESLPSLFLLLSFPEETIILKISSTAVLFLPISSYMTKKFARPSLRLPC